MVESLQRINISGLESVKPVVFISCKLTVYILTDSLHFPKSKWKVFDYYKLLLLLQRRNEHISEYMGKVYVHNYQFHKKRTFAFYIVIHLHSRPISTVCVCVSQIMFCYQLLQQGGNLKSNCGVSKYGLTFVRFLLNIIFVSEPINEKKRTSSTFIFFDNEPAITVCVKNVI